MYTLAGMPYLGKALTEVPLFDTEDICRLVRWILSVDFCQCSLVKGATALTFDTAAVC